MRQEREGLISILSKIRHKTKQATVCAEIRGMMKQVPVVDYKALSKTTSDHSKQS